jgi:squalene monooxygenase
LPAYCSTCSWPWHHQTTKLLTASLLLLPQVFCVTGSDAHEEMRQACFDYLAKGGSCASGPVSLLSGLNPSPSMLVMHFFSVALFGVGRLLRPRPTFRCVVQRN